MTRPAPGAPQAQQAAPSSPAAPGSEPGQPAAPGYPPAPGYAPPGYPPAPGYGPYPGTGFSTRAIMTPDGLPLAGAGYRLLARFLDGVIVAIVVLAVGFQLALGLMDALVDYVNTVDEAARTGTAVDPLAVYSTPGYVSNLLGLMAVQLVVSGLYHTTFIALRGATLGKLVAGVRVRPWDVDGRPSWGQAALRWATTDLGALLPMVGTFYALLDSLWLLWDNRRQCLHDKLPKTSVVRSR